jgi:hypothetical protein
VTAPTPIRKPGSSQFAGSIGSGRDTLPTSAPAVTQPVLDTRTVPSLAALHASLMGPVEYVLPEPGDDRPEPQVIPCPDCRGAGGFTTSVDGPEPCGSCRGTGNVDQAVLDAHAGCPFHDHEFSNVCTCPPAAPHLAWLCRLCEHTTSSCTCNGGPMYCLADGCANPQGSPEDDGGCDFCDNPADDVIDWPDGSHHVCTDCAKDETCDQCGQELGNGEGWNGLCGQCADKAEGLTVSCEHCGTTSSRDEDQHCTQCGRCLDCCHGYRMTGERC